ncbi:hypothetical protein [Stakelama marina]|uniref:Uncharacterized protein n=1 Tax=Stakelama marina TaxID=2826939 RepID=A0A8T4I7V0_9SPHN|nr:hypothetical protein [Stakelama marina]MBR0551068.1 hypothetical protein [Stakelama marina]
MYPTGPSRQPFVIVNHHFTAVRQMAAMDLPAKDRSDNRIFWSQTLLVLGVLALVSLMPPPRGPMLIISLRGQSADQMAGWAVHQRALPIDTGPIPGSLVVDGERNKLLGIAAEQGAIIITAAAAGCGRPTAW